MHIVYMFVSQHHEHVLLTFQCIHPTSEYVALQISGLHNGISHTENTDTMSPIMRSLNVMLSLRVSTSKKTAQLQICIAECRWIALSAWFRSTRFTL